MSLEYNLQPGTILGFTNCRPLSWAIALGTWGVPGISIIHVGIVAPLDKNSSKNVLYESTAEVRQPCLIQKKRIAGLQAHDLKWRIKAYKGRIWKYTPMNPFTEEQVDKLIDFCYDNLGVSYDFLGAWRARQAGFGWLEKRYREEDLSALFCSEFVAAAIRTSGYADIKNASKWSPRYLCKYLVNEGLYTYNRLK